MGMLDVTALEIAEPTWPTPGTARQRLMRAVVLTIGLVTCAFSLKAETASETQLEAPYDLSVNEGRRSPVGFHDATPSFSWKIRDSREGAAQTAYQLRVISQSDVGSQLLWDSGTVPSAQSVYVPYEGMPLKSRQRIEWMVRYWDQDGTSSPWSSAASLEMGLLAHSDWEAQWIGPNPDDFAGKDDERPAIYLRKSLHLDEVPPSARLYFTAKGLVDFSINGSPVTDDAFQPGWTNYNARIDVSTYDVTGLLKEGENVLTARIADGWYSGTISERFYGQRPQLLAQLEIASVNGGVEQTVATDNTWTYSINGPIIMSDLYHGEDYDARREMPGWDTPGYKSDGMYRPVTVANIDHAVKLSPKRFQTVRPIQTLKAKTFKRHPDGKLIYDLGQNMTGWIRINLPAVEGQKVTIRMAEMLQKDGSLYRANYRTARSMATYIPSEDGMVDYTQSFTYFGFRYVELSGYDVTATPAKEWVEGIVLHTDSPRTGYFESSHEKLNKLYSNIVWGQRGNFLDIPTDCPQRDERWGWTGDIQVFTPMALYNFDVHALLASYLDTMASEMGADGSVPAVVPQAHLSIFGNSAGWGDAAFIIPWQLYLRTGDVDVLREFYPMMKRRLHYYSNKARNNLVDEPRSFADWLQPRRYGDTVVGWDERSGETSTYLIASSYYGHGARLLSQASEVLGYTADAENYLNLSKKISQAISSTFFDSRGRVTEGQETQTAYILPLAFGLIEDDVRAKAVERLEERIEKDGGRLNTGFLGTSLLVSTLEEHGLLKQAIGVLFTSEYPGWFYSIDQGATTIWERWNSYSKETGFGDASMNSFNHYAYGAVGSFLTERIAGLAPVAEKPGYAQILIRPILSDDLPLDHASAALETRYGTAANKWRKVSGGWEVTTLIPPNATGKIVLDRSGNDIRILRGNLSFTERDKRSVAEVGAGTFKYLVVNEKQNHQ